MVPGGGIPHAITSLQELVFSTNGSPFVRRQVRQVVFRLTGIAHERTDRLQCSFTRSGGKRLAESETRGHRVEQRARGIEPRAAGSACGKLAQGD